MNLAHSSCFDVEASRPSDLDLLILVSWLSDELMYKPKVFLISTYIYLYVQHVEVVIQAIDQGSESCS